VSPFPAQTAPTRSAAERIELDLRRRRSLGDLYEAAPETLGEAIDTTLSWAAATGDTGPRTREYNERCARFWVPLRGIRVPMLRRGQIEAMIRERAAKHPRSAKNELEFLKRTLQ
jgi:hypothetical protein